MLVFYKHGMQGRNLKTNEVLYELLLHFMYALHLKEYPLKRLQRDAIQYSEII